MPSSNPAARPFSMGRAGTLFLTLSVLVLAGLAAGCEDENPDPIWTSTIDSVTLYSLARPELARESAFNFQIRSKIHVENPEQRREWDVAVDTRGGQLVLVPPGALGISASRARVAAVAGQSFAQVQLAPEDTLLYASTTVLPLSLTTTYVIRTDERRNLFGTTCVYFGKMQPIAIDAPGGTLRFIYDVSPVCNDRRLVPPDSLK